MKFTIKNLPETSTSGYVTSLQNESGPLATVFQTPTFNCQLFSIAGFGNLLANIKEDQDVRDAVATVVQQYGKNNILLDVLEHDVPRIRQVFNSGEEFLVDSPYRNNTGSSMRILIIKTNYLNDDYEDDDWEEDYEPDVDDEDDE